MCRIVVSMDLRGPYQLTNVMIDLYVEENKIGVYILGEIKGNHELTIFKTRYVGRAEKQDLRDRIKDWKEEYSGFKFAYASTKKDAYLMECELYHELGGLKGKLDNKQHPDAPDGTNWKCPKCPKD